MPLDLAERVGVVLLFAQFVQRMALRLTSLVLIEMAQPELIWQGADINAQALLLVIGEGLAVALILLRAPLGHVIATSARLAVELRRSERAAPAHQAGGGRHAHPGRLDHRADAGGRAAADAGKLALWRSFGLVPANRGVRTRGPYRLLRHPTYAGYTLTHIGFLLGFPSLQNALLYAGLFAIELVRLLREEALLGGDPAYRDYVMRLRYRLLPGVF